MTVGHYPEHSETSVAWSKVRSKVVLSNGGLPDQGNVAAPLALRGTLRAGFYTQDPGVGVVHAEMRAFLSRLANPVFLQVVGFPNQLTITIEQAQPVAVHQFRR